MKDSILAVDFGTTNSLAGAWTPTLLSPALPLDPTAADPSLFRSLLYFPDEDACFYGSEAIQKYLENEMEGRLFRSFKTHLPNQAYLGTMIGKRVMSLESMVGLFLLEIRKRAENLLQHEVKTVVLGRPARYSMDPVKDGFARHRMGKAAEFAGFTEVRFLPEPLAAAFDLRSRLKEEKIVLVGDFGGGTSDFTIFKLTPREFNAQDVLAIEGCPLAGDALDSVFMKNCLSVHFGSKSRYRLPLSSNVLTMPPTVSERLHFPAHIVHLRDKETFEFIRNVRQCAIAESDRKAVENLMTLVEEQLIFSFFETIEATKRELSEKKESQFIFTESDLDIRETIHRVDFHFWADGVRASIFEALDRALALAQLQPEQVDLVCLTGGTAKVPLIRRALEERFGAGKLQSSDSFHSVQRGLVEAARLWGEGKATMGDW